MSSLKQVTTHSDSDRRKSLQAVLLIEIGFTYAALLFSPAMSIGQKASIKAVDRNIAPKLNKDKAGVYISYSKYDKPSVGTSADDNQYVWLRLHNNLIWDINVCVYEKSEVSQKIIGLHYEIDVRIPALRSTLVVDGVRVDDKGEKIIDPTPPRGIPPYDFCSEFVVKSGSAHYFRADRSHFVQDGLLVVGFYYPWEDVSEARTGREPRHQVYFYSNELVNRK